MGQVWVKQIKMKVTGKIHFVGAIRKVSDKFKSKDVVILTDEKYPQYISIQFTQEKTELISQNNIGEQVEVSINLRGREWKSPTGEIKYFNTIRKFFRLFLAFRI